jgi:fumarylacetoacetate (FAA) hydrolase family protein
MSLTALQASAYLHHLHLTTPQPERLAAFYGEAMDMNVEVLSDGLWLATGDVIATGTTGGVGFKREPQVFMKDGDRVEVTIDGFGTLVNTIEQEPGSDSNHHVGN